MSLNMYTVVKRVDLLETVEKNFAQHKQIVKEAREGYVEQATKALKEKLKEVAKGGIAHISFSLSPPVEHNDTYITAIEMLKWNQNETLQLTANEFRNLVLDKWDWSRGFYVTNAIYSTGACYLAGPSGLGYLP